MADNVVLACDRDGLGAGLRAHLLGGYDGRGAWRIFVDRVEGSSEHLMVQVHEALHHELQTATVWGCITALSALLADRGLRPLALMDVFDYGIAASTTVHEMYATFLADVTGRNRYDVDVLKGNPRYRDYRDRAAQLLPVGDDIAADIHASAVSAVLRSCMQPQGLVPVVEQLDFRTLTTANLRGAVPITPDRRLDLLEAAVDPGPWRDLLRELSASDPGHQTAILAAQRPTTSDDMSRLHEQWQFDVEVVQRRCYDLAAATLGAAGTSTIPWHRFGELTEAVITAATAADPELAEMLRLGDTTPMAEGSDVLEFARQGIRLRDPLPLEVATIDQRATLEALDAFVVQVGTANEHVCGLWTDPAVLAKQFRAAAVPDDLRVCLFTRAPDSAANAVARVGSLDTKLSPRHLQQLVAPRPLLVLTTHYALADERTYQRLAEVDPVFVWMDLPIGWHVDHWVQQGGTVRYAVATVDRDRELALLTIRIDRAPHLRLFHIGGLVALGSLLERLRQRHNDDVVAHDQRVLTDDAAGYTLAASHVLHTFSLLDQDGVS